MIKEFMLVALGGSLGASLRHLWGIALKSAFGPTEFPVAILSANILGSFLMGVFVSLAAQKGLTHLNPFVAIGVLGGFTTFSTFSLETYRLIETGHYMQMALYVGLSVGVSVLALVVGMWAVREVLA